ncbi:cilia- and flagella-associated protein 100-like [Chaetodon trifascialis]|uniref:cilia- and flagella-associated protein 100-like n=1 Tax=Chaetodon trifascialis TaxID=109706 RepID=UPI0039944FC7
MWRQKRSACPPQPSPRPRGRVKGEREFKMPGINTVTTLSDEEKEHRKMMASRILAKQNRERTGELAGEIKNDTRHQQTTYALEHSKPSIEPKTIAFIEKRNAMLDVSLAMEKFEITQLKREIAMKEHELKQLEKVIEIKNSNSQKFLRVIQNKSNNAVALLEKERHANQEKDAVIKDLKNKIESITSEIANNEDVLSDYKRHKNCLLKLCPPEWQEAQQARDWKESQQGLLRLTCSAHDIKVANPTLDHDNSEDEEKKYFSDPKQLLDYLEKLKDDTLSLIERAGLLDIKTKKPQQAVQATLNKIKETKDRHELELMSIKGEINKVKKATAELQQRIKINDPSKSTDQDVILRAIDAKVKEVQSSFMNRKLAFLLSTMEKMATIEVQVNNLIEEIEEIPKESLQKLKSRRDNARRRKEFFKRMNK